MTIEANFRQRSVEIADYLKSLRSLEVLHAQPGRGFYKAASAITASRASAFIMIYNCMEFGARESLIRLRQDIAASGYGYDRLKSYWQEEIVHAHFHERLQQGCNNAQLVRDFSAFAPGVVTWRNAIDRLPFPGNVDNLQLLKLAEKLEVTWRPPRSSLGGSDLVLVRQLRNVLSHGSETFEAVGSQFSTSDISDKFDRVRTFMVSLIRALERYRVRQLYRT
jgi:hypothetical protein